MTDGITVRADGKAEMAYVGAVPWHRMGQELKPGASIEEWREAAGFDFNINKHNVLYKSEDGALHEMADRVVLHRSDNNAALSIVSDEYKIVQPSEVLDYFADLSDRAGFQLETAGTLFGGKQFWGLANIGEELCIRDKRDVVKGRLLMATSVDQSLPTTLKFVNERVVCHNTLTWALHETGSTTVRVRHRTTFQPEKVNKELGIMAREQFAETIDDLRKLAEFELEPLDLVHASIYLVKPDADELNADELKRAMCTRSIQRVATLALEGSAIGAELLGSRGTAWGWLNCTTQYVDHELRSRSDDWRVQRAWFGDGEKLKMRAAGIANDLVNGKKLDKLAIEGDDLLELIV